MNESKFKVGDKVQWMHVTQNGRRMGFSQRKGKIIELHAKGVTVKKRNSRTKYLEFNEIRLVGEKGQVTEVFEKIVEQTKEVANVG